MYEFFNLRWKLSQVVVSHVESSETFTKVREVGRKRRAGQVVVRQVKYLEGWEGSKTSRQLTQTIEPLGRKGRGGGEKGGRERGREREGEGEKRGRFERRGGEKKGGGRERGRKRRRGEGEKGREGERGGKRGIEP